MIADRDGHAVVQETVSEIFGFRPRGRREERHR
jgi:hypothetical protein